MSEIKESALQLWGDRDTIREVATRCKMMIPGIILLPASMRESVALSIAQIAVMAGLNPFLGEIWPIPQRNRDGKITGIQTMVGIKGLRRVAKVQAKQMGLIPPYYRPTWRQPDDDEKEALELQPGDIAIVCQLELFLPPGHPWYHDGWRRYVVEGLGVVRKNDRSKMERLQLVRKRAESDAIKQAFDIPLGDAVTDAEYAESEAWAVIEPEPETPEPTMGELVQEWNDGAADRAAEREVTSG